MAKVTAYKGFDKNWSCRGFKYGEPKGQSFSHDGDVSLCEGGFHACEYPLDVFNYYAPGESLYAQVEQSGKVVKGDDKSTSSKITIKAAISIPEIVSASIEYTKERCDPVKAKHATGDQSASSATGDRSASSATGYQSASSATGYQSASSATGDRSASSATGYQSASSATGYQSASSATGYQSASSATGDRSASSATGEFSVAAAFGLASKAKAGATGTVIVAWWDGKRKRYTVGYVGENGIEKDIWYAANDRGELVAM
jgi:hypothetical protein